jgi:drug/metabolite transporter (DMT)-like permease
LYKWRDINLLTAIKKRFSEKDIALLLMTVAIILFSTIEVFSKRVQPEVTPIVLAFMRFLIGGIILSIILPFRYSSLPKGAIIENWKGIAFFGFLGIGFTFILFHWGLSMTMASNAAVIFSANPIFVAIFASLQEKKRISFWFSLSILFAILGLFFVGFKVPEEITSRNFLFGNILMLLAAIIWAWVYTLKGKEYVHKFGPVRTPILSFGTGIIPLFLAILFSKEDLTVLLHLSIETWIYLAFLGGAATGIGHWLFFEGLLKGEAEKVTTPFYLKPVIAPVLAYIFLGEQILADWVFRVGVIFLFSAIILAQIKSPTGEKDVGNYH